MKGVLFSLAILFLIFLGMGCQTVPRHLVQQEVIIIYPPEYPITPILIGGPPPVPPPTNPVTPPKIRNPKPPRDGNPSNSNSGGIYTERDPLKGGSPRDPGKIKTPPPVKKSGQNDRVQ
jgi:hypothetical protein